MPIEVTVIPCRTDNYAYLLQDRESGKTAVVDVPDAAPVVDVLARMELPLHQILLTHHHLDHVEGVAALRSETGAIVVGNAEDARRLPPLDSAVSDGDRIAVAGQEAKVIDVSGHTIGHIAYVFADEDWAFTGDSLMMLGCGRVFEGSFEMMYRSLAKFGPMPDTMRICSGHEYAESNARFALSVEPDNPHVQERAEWVRKMRSARSPTVPSPLGAERMTNPFLRCHLPEMKAALGMESAANVDVFAELRTRKDNF